MQKPYNISKILLHFNTSNQQFSVHIQLETNELPRKDNNFSA